MKEQLHRWALVAVLAIIAFELHNLNQNLSYAPTNLSSLSGGGPLNGIHDQLLDISVGVDNIAKALTD